METPFPRARLVALFSTFTAIIALYWPSAVALHELWMDGARTTYTHGYLIAAITIWLIWRERVSACSGDSKPVSTLHRIVTAVALLATALLWQFAYRGGIQLAIELLLLPLLWLSALLLFGRNAARATLFPIFFMVLALPFWDGLNPLLQYCTVHAAQILLRLVGVPVYFHGNNAEIPEGVFEIQGGCSGLHYFLVALTVAVLIGEVRRDHWRRRLRWIVIGVLLAVAVNWFRVASIILIGHVSHMQNYLVRVSHYGYGWALFALILLALFLIERRTALLASPENSSLSTPQSTAPWSPVWSATAILIVALPMVMNAIVSSRLAAQTTRTELQEASLPAGWHLSKDTAARWAPVQNNADDQVHRIFERGDVRVDYYIAQYREQFVGKKVGGYANRPQGDANVLESGKLDSDPRIAYLLVEHDGLKSLLFVSYRVDGRLFANATSAQLWYSWINLRSLSSPISDVVVWRTPCTPDCSAAREQLEAFRKKGPS